ncbi:siderophore-interacting protein [Microbacterium gubbeenense]|uniref:siderophore-interacting protein n=1 Tax=Microbacterium gubbeenense TaxID=159896 RepID=UPI0003FB9F05|nr:siderophore-interacting protein [Microbacterium gubbeenense]
MDKAALSRVATEVLSHPEHATGLDHPTLTIHSVVRLGSGLTRVIGTLSAVHAREIWEGPNATLRLAIPTPEGDSASRVYTVRRFHDEAALVEIDIVVHAESSPAMDWLRVVAPGDEIAVTGPREHFLPLFIGDEPVLMLADSSAVPAVASILAYWPAGTPAQVVAAVADEAELDDVPDVPRVDIRTIVVSSEAQQQPLLGAARDAASFRTVWAAGERDEMRSIRRYFRDDVGLPKEAVQVFGYWKHGVSGTALDIRRVLHLKTLLDSGKGMADFDEFDIDA